MSEIGSSILTSVIVAIIAGVVLLWLEHGRRGDGRGIAILSQ